MANESTRMRAADLPNYAAAVADGEGEEGEHGCSPIGDYENHEKRNDGLATPTCLLIAGHVAGVAMAICVCASSACAQSLGGYVPMFELNAWRFGVMWIIVLPFIIGRWSNVRVLVAGRSERLYLVLYCLLSNVYNITFYEASIYLPVGVLGGTEFTLIILITAIGSAVLARKCLAIITVSATLAIIGIFLLVQPEFLFKHIISVSKMSTKPICLHSGPTQMLFDLTNNVSQYNSSKASHHEYNGSAYVWVNRSESTPLLNTTTNGSSRQSSDPASAIFLGYVRVGAAASAQAIQIFIMRYRLQDSDWFVNLFWQSVMGLTISLPLMALYEELVFPQSATCVALLCAHSLAASLVSVMMQVSTSTIPAFTHSLLASLSLVFMIVAQYTALRHVNAGHQNALEVIGAALVLVATVSEPIYRFCSQRQKGGDRENDDDIALGS